MRLLPDARRFLADHPIGPNRVVEIKLRLYRFLSLRIRLVLAVFRIGLAGLVHVPDAMKLSGGLKRPLTAGGVQLRRFQSWLLPLWPREILI